MTQEQNKIMTLYGLFIVSIIFNFVPSVTIQTVGMIIFFICFVALYIVRAKAKKAGLTYSHSSFIIKSVWISSLFLLIGSVAAGIFGDHSIIDSTVDSITNGTVMSEEQLQEIFMEYSRTNFMIFMATLLPSILYFLYRLVIGDLS